MKKGLLLVGLLISMICQYGCNIGGGFGGISGDKTIARIDAVDKLKFERDKRREYRKIASRAGISPDAQVYLVQTVFKKLTFENAKEEVLLALIKNPSFSNSAEKTIMANLDKLVFESSKQEILKALSERKMSDEAGG